MPSQYERFLNRDNFIHAWRIIKNSDRFDAKDRLGIEIFAAQTDIHIDILIREIETKGFTPGQPHFYQKPKQDGSTHPITFLNIYDRIVYQAIGNIILQDAYKDIQPFLNLTIFSSVPQPPDETNQFGDFMFFPAFSKAHFTGQYPLFISAIDRNRLEYATHEDSYEIYCDIKSFYPSVRHSTLFRELRNWRWLRDDKLANLLGRCLSTWAFDKENHQFGQGIPIGYETSDLLATLFLHSLDDEYKNYSFLRFVDDMRFYVIGGEAETTQVLEEVNLELQRLDLSLNLIKTKSTAIFAIADNKPVRPSLFEGVEDSDNNRFVSEDDFFQLYTDTENPYNLDLLREYGRQLAFILYRLNTKNSFIRDTAIYMLSEIPRWSIHATHYLSQFERDATVIRVLKNTAYDTQKLSTVRLDCIRALLAITGLTIELAEGLQSLLISETDWYFRYEVLELISSHISCEFALKFANEDNCLLVKTKILRIGFDAATNESQKIVVINQALSSNEKYLQALGIYLWRRSVSISRSKLKLTRLKKNYKKLYLSDEEQTAEFQFTITFYFLFDFRLSPDLPIHLIFAEETNPLQYLLDAIDAEKTNHETYVNAIYLFAFEVLLFVAKSKHPNLVAYRISDLQGKLDQESWRSAELLRRLRWDIDKGETIEYKDIDRLRPQLKKLFAINFMKIHQHLEFEVDSTLERTYREFIKMRDKVFISYTRADRYWREQVEIALKPKFRGTDAIWADVNLNPGAMWKQEIEQLLDRAKIAILLVTKEFCASEFINDVELPSILAAANRKELTVVWISVGHSDYKALGLDKFNCANDPKYPLKDVPEKVDAILVDIANFVYDRFHGLR